MGCRSSWGRLPGWSSGAGFGGSESLFPVPATHEPLQTRQDVGSRVNLAGERETFGLRQRHRSAFVALRIGPRTESIDQHRQARILGALLANEVRHDEATTTAEDPRCFSEEPAPRREVERAFDGEHAIKGRIRQRHRTRICLEPNQLAARRRSQRP